MDDDKQQAWMKVGLHFAAAGDKLREHGKAAVSETPPNEPDQAAVVDALNTLGKALNQAVNGISGAVKDPAVRDELKRALDSMGEAMNVTFTDVGDKVGDKIKDTFGRKPE